MKICNVNLCAYIYILYGKYTTHNHTYIYTHIHTHTNITYILPYTAPFTYLCIFTRLQPYMIIPPSPLKHQIIAQNKVFARLQTRCSTVRQYITISATFTWSGICNRYQAIAILLTLTGSCQVPELLVCNQCSGFDEGFLENVSIGRFDSLVIMLLCFHYFESKLLVEIQCTVIVNLYM